MDIKYKVASCSQEDVVVKAIVAGKEVDVKAPGLVVELVSDCGKMGHTYRFIPADMAEALEMFTVGEPIILTFNKPE